MYEKLCMRSEREGGVLWFMDIYSGSKRRIVASGIFTAPPDVGGGALMSHKGP